jgi:hypothetical protein
MSVASVAGVSDFTFPRRALFGLSLTPLALTSLACYATAGVDAEPVYVEADYVPPRIEVYPRYYYRGRTVYYIDGHWYHRRGSRWVYYREEPPELYRQRVYVERAPRAPDRNQHRHGRRRARPHRHDD